MATIISNKYNLLAQRLEEPAKREREKLMELEAEIRLLIQKFEEKEKTIITVSGDELNKLRLTGDIERLYKKATTYSKCLPKLHL